MTGSDLYLYYNNIDGSIVSVTESINPDLSEYPFMRIPYGVGEKFLQDENTIHEWIVNIVDDSHDIISKDSAGLQKEKINLLSELSLSYIDLSDQNAEVNESDLIYITLKNDQTVILDSFHVDKENIEKLRSLDETIHAAYIRHEDKEYHIKESKDDSLYVYYNRIDGSIISISDSERYYIHAHPFLKINKNNKNGFSEGYEFLEEWRVNVTGDTREIVSFNYKETTLNPSLFRLDDKIDRNVIMMSEGEINVIQPQVFNVSNRQVYITAKNDPMVLLSQFYIDTSERYQIEYIDDCEYDS